MNIIAQGGTRLSLSRWQTKHPILHAFWTVGNDMVILMLSRLLHRHRQARNGTPILSVHSITLNGNETRMERVWLNLAKHSALCFLFPSPMLFLLWVYVNNHQSLPQAIFQVCYTSPFPNIPPPLSQIFFLSPYWCRKSKSLLYKWDFFLHLVFWCYLVKTKWLARCWRLSWNLILLALFTWPHFVSCNFFLSLLFSCFSHSYFYVHNSGFGSASSSDSTRAREPDSSRRWDGASELRNNRKPCPNGALEEGRGACLHPWLTHLAPGYRSSADPLYQGRKIHVNGTFPQLYNTLILQCMMYVQMAFYLPRPSWTQFNNCFSFTAICKIASNSQADKTFFSSAITIVSSLC